MIVSTGSGDQEASERSLHQTCLQGYPVAALLSETRREDDSRPDPGVGCLTDHFDCTRRGDCDHDEVDLARFREVVDGRHAGLLVAGPVCEHLAGETAPHQVAVGHLAPRPRPRGQAGDSDSLREHETVERSDVVPPRLRRSGFGHGSPGAVPSGAVPSGAALSTPDIAAERSAASE